MARTLATISKQIEALQREAEKIRAKEVEGVIAKIKAAIDFYGLQPADLFGAKKGRRGAAAKVPAVSKKKPSAPKYRDEATGETWTGRGRKPGWFVQALAAGKTPEDMSV